MGFGENEVGRRLRHDPTLRRRLSSLKRELDQLVMRIFEETLDQIGASGQQRPDLGGDYLQTLQRMGIS